jgi:thymidylate kinase
MIVVLEGLPGVGKTTTLTNLKRHPNYRVIPEILGPEPIVAAEDFYVRNDTQKYLLAFGAQTAVMDRSFVSTLCYNYCSDILRGTRNYGRIARLIDNAIARGELRQPDLYIFLRCSVDECLDRQNTTNDPLWQSRECLVAAQRFYADYFARQDVPVVEIDVSRYPAAEVTRQVLAYIRDFKQQSIKEKMHV